MDPLTLIQLLGALLAAVGEASTAIDKIKTVLDQNTEMTDEQRAAYQQLLATDHAKDYWQDD